MTTLAYGVLLALGVALLAVTAVRVRVGGLDRRAGQPGPPGETGGARRILEERYAAGEMSTEEFQHRLQVLEGGQP